MSAGDGTSRRTTTDAGVPAVSDDTSLTAGSGGPILRIGFGGLCRSAA
jgi:hypothetical protein